MALRFSSFTIKDILTGCDARGKPCTRSTEELCAPKRNIGTGHGTRVSDRSHQDVNENRIHRERLPADLRLSVGNVRSATSNKEATGEETELSEEEQPHGVERDERKKEEAEAEEDGCLPAPPLPALLLPALEQGQYVLWRDALKPSHIFREYMTGTNVSQLRWDKCIKGWAELECATQT
ncbi:hypothetical protein FQN60_015017 [Etheostoma spectabile]|uniref:Uncharacterized protein n=1 Tax=Etheostoma spectabile TaxID=54343 RepID=A0A5J5CSA9_9PERO|nr:hypothetical protein FQN60_015017 [Etheostoma spectabile]